MNKNDRAVLSWSSNAIKSLYVIFVKSGTAYNRTVLLVTLILGHAIPFRIARPIILKMRTAWICHVCFWSHSSRWWSHPSPPVWRIGRGGGWLTTPSPPREWLATLFGVVKSPQLYPAWLRRLLDHLNQLLGMADHLKGDLNTLLPSLFFIILFS